MKALLLTIAITTFAALASASASADEHARSNARSNDGLCSTKALAGRWLFATDVGQQMLTNLFPPEKDVTAIGTMNIRSDGRISGKFDVTVEDTVFLPDVTYEGNLQVNPDCTGFLSFVNSAGAMRTDSIAVVGRREILGMSQDPFNLWNYQIRKIASLNRDQNDRQD